MSPLVAAALVTWCISAAVGEDLIVDVLSKPSDCTRKSSNGDYLYVHYDGTLAADGSQFDSSRSRGEPFVFQVGKGQVIRGWDEGMLDMCIGEKRKLTIPPSKGYGDTGTGRIPGGAWLVFDVELMDIKDHAEEEKQPNIFKQIDVDGDKKLTVLEISSYIKQQVPGKTLSDEEEKSHHKLIADIISHDDTDKDGAISFDEFSGPKHEEL